MAAFLIVQRGEDIGRRFDLDTTQLTVGRGSDNDMVLNDPMVSRYHAVVKRQGNGYLVIDLGSSNPVVINEYVCEPGEPRLLQHRDVVFIGKTVFSFQNRSGGSISMPARDQQPMDRTTIGVQVGGSGGATDSPTPPPPSRQVSPPTGGSMQEERTSASTPKIEPSTSPSMPTVPPPPPAGVPEAGEEERTMIAGMQRPADPGPAPFMPPPPPPIGARPIDDDSTRPTPGMPPMGAGAPPPPPPPFSPPRPGGPPAPPLGGPGDDEDGDMPTQIVPRRS